MIYENAVYTIHTRASAYRPHILQLPNMGVSLLRDDEGVPIPRLQREFGRFRGFTSLPASVHALMLATEIKWDYLEDRGYWV